VQSAPFCRVLDGNPDIDLLIYNEQLYFRGIPEETADWIRTLPIDLTGGAMLYRLDLKLACKTSDAFRQHISYRFAELVQVPIDSPRPLVFLNEIERRAASLLSPKPLVVFSMNSVSNPEREDKRGRKKDWPVERWAELAQRILSAGELDVAIIGSERDARVAIPGARLLYGLPIKIVAALLERAACVVTLESGIGHLASAVDATTVVIYSNMMPPEWASPHDLSRYRILYGDPLDTSVDQVMKAVDDLTAQTVVAAL
jgi:ADP-heptose:LPS heptosyltransferase